MNLLDFGVFIIHVTASDICMFIKHAIGLIMYQDFKRC
jgi:hypothetical protein